MDFDKLLEISSTYMSTCLNSNYHFPHLFYNEAQMAQVKLFPWYLAKSKAMLPFSSPFITYIGFSPAQLFRTQQFQRSKKHTETKYNGFQWNTLERSAYSIELKKKFQWYAEEIISV